MSVVGTLILALAPAAHAVTITASGVSVGAVQAAVNAASVGDTVVVPAGSASWTSPLSITKGIELKGAGIGSTIITNPSTGWQVGIINVKAVIGQQVTIDGFTFIGSGGNEDVIVMTGSTRAFRIHDNKFTNGGAHSVWIWGDCYGVIDHNQFINPSREVISLFDKGTGDDSWSRPLSFGTAEAVYAEDNVFDFETIGDHAITGVNGTRYVFRHNTVHSSAALNASQVDGHGNYFDDRGIRSFEVYDNTLSSDSSYQGFYMRGGAGVIFGNTMTGSYYHPMIFTNYRSWETDAPGSCGYDACSYPAPDQLHDVYVWNNTYNGATVTPWVTDRGLDRTHIQQGRDYFLSAMPGYTPYTYPHPLVTGGSSSSGSGSGGGSVTPPSDPPPTAPTNLRASR